MAKFVDFKVKNDQKDEEMIVRGVAGDSFLTFVTTSIHHPSGTVPVLEIRYHGSSLNEVAKGKVLNDNFLLPFMEEESILTLYNLLARKTNNGDGLVQSLTGPFIGVITGQELVTIYCVSSTKDFYKICKNVMKYGPKKLKWAIDIPCEGMEKITKELKKMIDKKFKGLLDDTPKAEEEEAKNEVF